MNGRPDPKLRAVLSVCSSSLLRFAARVVPPVCLRPRTSHMSVDIGSSYLSLVMSVISTGPLVTSVGTVTTAGSRDLKCKVRPL